MGGYRVVRCRAMTSTFVSRQVMRIFGRYEAAVEYADSMNEDAVGKKYHYIVEPL